MRLLVGGRSQSGSPLRCAPHSIGLNRIVPAKRLHFGQNLNQLTGIRMIGRPVPSGKAMNLVTYFAGVGFTFTLVLAGQAASTGNAFYGDPPDEHHPWAIHDRNRPQPKLVAPGTPSTPAQAGKPPGDA